ncbi:MFS transporter [Pseudodesulfovibrio sp. JC047]|uniref:MFS transporter n=1 Tax=Pseudodesulfovibrio sp. JC047 TaxID=2683199 RepID=UPI0013D77289|nr:MFS transporter [Pseudodesulfovibrio sp. JC047]NDV18580.1 MFS transporter [Pseudodesulfovibrio sp. JC047]
MQTFEQDTAHTGDHRPLTAIILGGLFTALGGGLFAFTIPLLSLDERISGAWLGTAFAGYYLAKLLVAPLSGMAADRFGPRRVLTLAMGIGCLIPLCYFLVPELSTLYAIQVIMGIVLGLVRPVGMATLGSTGSGSALSRRFAIHAAAFSGAAFIGPILGSLLYFNRSMEPVLLGLAACLGLATLMTMWLLPSKITTIRPEEPKTPTLHRAGDTATALFIALSGRTLGIGLLTAFYPILLANTLGRNGLTIAFIYAIPGLATFLGLTVSGRFSTRKPDLDRVAFGMMLSAGSLFMLGSSSQAWQFITFGTLMGLGAALSIPPSMALAATLSQRQGVLFGAANTASGLGFLFGPLLGGVLIQIFHSLVPAMQVAAALGALACLPLIAITLRDHFYWSGTQSKGITIFLALLLIVIMGFSLTAQTEKTTFGKDLYKFTDVAMGTIVNLTIEAQNEKTASDAAKKTMSAIWAYQQDLDHRNPEGSIGRINRSAGVSWVKPTPRAFDVLQRAFTVSEHSQGVFDPTIGALTTTPLYFALDETVAHAKSPLVDYRQVLFDIPGRRVKLKKKGMALDLGGIAKGTIVDAAVALLRKQGIQSGIVEAGGDFYCFGKRDWTVGIRHPRNSAEIQTISIREKGVCGSGDYQQFITTKKAGKTITRHHIINPSTMESAHKSLGVTVVANSAEQADVQATTLFIMGPAQGTDYLKKHAPDSKAIWFLPNNTVATTKNFP